VKRLESLDWQMHLAHELDTAIVSLRALGGGDFAQSFQATLDDSRRIFVKTHENPPEGFFSTEAAGLQWLNAAEAVNVPKVILFSDSPPCLALEWIDVGRSGKSNEADFGRQLARLHATTPACFGREDKRTTGSLALANEPSEQWSEFYMNNRLLPLAKIARTRRALNERTIERIERLATMLEQFGACDEPPARLHGDLWAGNRLIDNKGNSWIIDPAAHGGHREFDLAMMRLFGGYGDACFSAYHEVYPLQPNWQERIALHQLAPLIVHAIKFGGSYPSAVNNALQQFV